MTISNTPLIRGFGSLDYVSYLKPAELLNKAGWNLKCVVEEGDHEYPLWPQD